MGIQSYTALYFIDLWDVSTPTATYINYHKVRTAAEAATLDEYALTHTPWSTWAQIPGWLCAQREWQHFLTHKTVGAGGQVLVGVSQKGLSRRGRLMTYFITARTGVIERLNALLRIVSTLVSVVLTSGLLHWLLQSAMTVMVYLSVFPRSCQQVEHEVGCILEQLAFSGFVYNGHGSLPRYWRIGDAAINCWLKCSLVRLIWLVTSKWFGLPSPNLYHMWTLNP